MFFSKVNQILLWHDAQPINFDTYIYELPKNYLNWRLQFFLLIGLTRCTEIFASSGFYFWHLIFTFQILKVSVLRNFLIIPPVNLGFLSLSQYIFFLSHWFHFVFSFSLPINNFFSLLMYFGLGSLSLSQSVNCFLFLSLALSILFFH